MDITLFGRHILTWKHHYIMSQAVPAAKIPDPSADARPQIKAVSEENLSLWTGGGYSQRLLRNLMRTQNACRGYYYFAHSDDPLPCATIWVICSPGEEVEYKLRNCEAFIFNVYVLEPYRGKGIASVLLDAVFRDLAEHGVESCALAVRVNNLPAIRAYEKYGFEKIAEKRFFRILGSSVPKYTL